MNIFLIRHGETEANLKEGAEPVLTVKGKKQAQRLAEKLAERDINFLLSSDLERAILTAEEIKKLKPELKIKKTKELREIYRVIVGGPEKQNTPEERVDNDLKRAEKAWKQLIELDYENIAVCCHWNLIRYFISRVFNSPANKFYNLDIHPASISKIVLNKNTKEIRVVFINNISHLPKELRSQNLFYI